MKKPTDENLSQTESVSEETSSVAAPPKSGLGKDVEEIHLVGERTPVAHDEQTIKDEYVDYKFSQSRKKVHTHRICCMLPRPEALTVPLTDTIRIIHTIRTTLPVPAAIRTTTITGTTARE